jgi:hypothetical protein
VLVKDLLGGQQSPKALYALPEGYTHLLSYLLLGISLIFILYVCYYRSCECQGLCKRPGQFPPRQGGEVEERWLMGHSTTDAGKHNGGHGRYG